MKYIIFKLRIIRIHLAFKIEGRHWSRALCFLFISSSPSGCQISLRSSIRKIFPATSHVPKRSSFLEITFSSRSYRNISGIMMQVIMRSLNFILLVPRLIPSDAKLIDQRSIWKWRRSYLQILLSIQYHCVNGNLAGTLVSRKAARLHVTAGPEYLFEVEFVLMKIFNPHPRTVIDVVQPISGRHLSAAWAFFNFLSTCKGSKALSS